MAEVEASERTSTTLASGYPTNLSVLLTRFNLALTSVWFVPRLAASGKEKQSEEPVLWVPTIGINSHFLPLLECYALEKILVRFPASPFGAHICPSSVFAPLFSTNSFPLHDSIGHQVEEDVFATEPPRLVLSSTAFLLKFHHLLLMKSGVLRIDTLSLLLSIVLMASERI
ncbi:hypothetical protein KC19_6G095400 [Ceratodon purpureus]|uniref:Uncharacterized protein n=1 Tax=Ceratodon purpureus TaxID=3225 RepID=A0A8T0HDA3_CERPU|nr:hypothetical protein KC19_6G095400 [Ceratodon purpureus]